MQSEVLFSPFQSIESVFSGYVVAIAGALLVILYLMSKFNTAAEFARNLGWLQDKREQDDPSADAPEPRYVIEGITIINVDASESGTESVKDSLGEVNDAEELLDAVQDLDEEALLEALNARTIERANENDRETEDSETDR